MARPISLAMMLLLCLLDAFHKEIHRKILLQLSLEERKNVISCLQLLRSSMEAVKEEMV